ncbi:MAG: hypothetical protein AB8I69_23075, partial [Anaerolineae bacterium]
MTKQKLFKTTAALLFGVVLWVVLALFLASSDRQVARADPGTIYVDVDAPGTPDGLTWSTAFTNVQDALVAAVAGDDIWVAEGVYYPDEGSGQADDDRDSTFQLKRGVALYGGFVGIETSLTERNWTTYVTVLSGDIDRNDATDAKGVVTDTNGIVGTNAYNVVTSQSVTETAVLDGFTITAGNADGGSCPGPWCGGGMLNYSDFGDNWADPTVRHVVFSANRTTGWGGGMYNANDADPVLVDVTFVGNSAYYGGGMANQYGSTPRLNGATFEDNFATWGGGMYSEASSAILTSTTFIGNTASRGGGI